MKKNPDSRSGLFNPRLLLACRAVAWRRRAFTLCSVGVFLAALGFAATPTPAGWSLITSPNPSGGLNSVTCASASDCWAVGSNGPTLIEHWNGNSWSIVPSPNGNNTGSNALSAVACGSASECWAVGNYTYYYNGSSVSQALIEKWDGTSWTIVTPPYSSTLSNTLIGVTCASASDCWALGSYTYSDNGFPFPTYHSQPLIEHWDGVAWTVVSSPNVSISSLAAVTCTSASDCWAVAGWGQLIEHWDGNSWAVVASPNTGENNVQLMSVACASSSECWAVGYYNTGGEENYELIERWDGSAWTAFFGSPSTSALAAVTCVSASDCWAVGNVHFQRWDGTSWSDVTSPNASGYLNGLACASASECWAVGIATGGAVQPLIEEYAPTIPPLTSIVSRKIHGSAGMFDINLPLIGTRGIECRSPGATGTAGVDYKLVFTFVNNLTSCGTASTGSLSSGPNSNQCTVSLTGVANQQYLTVTLNNVLDSKNNTGNVAATMGVLVGDVNANGVVTNADVSLVKAQVASGASVGLSNFRDDINANGLLSNADVSLTKAQVAAGAQLPTPP